MKNNSISKFLDNFIIILILLVMVQTALEDIAVLQGWSARARNILIITGFCFDAFFTMEFMVRFFVALSKGRASEYFMHERGWVDFVASIPLIILNSGPSFYGLMTGTVILGAGGVLNVLKAVKSIRTARILRMLRFLKIFKQIKYADSAMAQRHVTKIITTSVTVIIVSVMVFQSIFSFLTIRDLETQVDEDARILADFLDSVGADNNTGLLLGNYFEEKGNFLIVKLNGSTIYTRYDDDYYTKYYTVNDYQYEKSGNWEFFVDLYPVKAEQSKDNLMIFFLVFSLIIVFMLTYSPHFALTVSDPINVMIKGLKDKSYNLEVSVPERFEEDDVFRLASKYNEEYLPLKARNEMEDSSSPSLELDNFDDLFS